MTQPTTPVYRGGVSRELIYWAEYKHAVDFDYIDDAVKCVIDNLPDLFVQWLACAASTPGIEEDWCENAPLGKLMKEVLDENKSIK